MCITLYIHNTTRRHDTRFLSVLNPVTGYTVYSPFQDPYVKPSPCECPIPHTQPGHPHPDVPAPHEVCLWHAPCCRLEIIDLCRRTNSCHDGRDSQESCWTWTKYHHFCETPQGRDDRSFLRDYFLLSQPHDNAFLPFAAHFFKAGVELALANRYHAQAARRLRDADVMLRLPVPEKQALTRQAVYFDRVSRCAVEVLAQFALHWDAFSAGAGARTGAGAIWPARPGAARYPALNAAVDALKLRAANWARDDDVAPVAWPGGEAPWESFKGMLPFPGDDPAAVAWCYYPDGSAPGGHRGWGERFAGDKLDPALFKDAGNDVPEVFAGLEMFAGADDFALDPEFDFDFDFDFGSGVGLGITAPPARWDWGLGESMQNLDMGKDMDVDMAMDLNMDVDMPPVSWDAVAVGSNVAATRGQDSSAASSSSSYPAPSVLSTSSSEESDDDDDDDETEYPVERLVDHRPRRGPRAGVKYYRVRWQGDWPAREKETWQHRSHIAPQLIREYWLVYDRENAHMGKKKKTGGHRARWGAKRTRPVGE
ncbi:hypothetical protein F4809DRAFT_660814 [Biscogniauxia mediterranea]|nr:hypothetical protein F4809DRAFT_660814 [Biscogniauxia mediterranea]